MALLMLYAHTHTHIFNHVPSCSLMFLNQNSMIPKDIVARYQENPFKQLTDLVNTGSNV